MATANELYAMKPESISNDLSRLSGCYYNHIQEFNEHDEYLGDEVQQRVEIRTLKFFDFDGRRFWKLSTVFFDGNPVMVIQNAGREGDDHSKRFITDTNLFMSMGKFIKSLIKSGNELPEQVDCNMDIPELTEFYGNSLHGEFKRH